MEATVLVICLAGMIVSGVAAAMFRSSLKAAISLGLSSLFLAIILFIMRCPWAALFELSVCAGLVTVVFVSTISMTNQDRHSQASVTDHRNRYAALPFVLIFVGVAMVAVILLSGFDLRPVASSFTAASDNFKEVLWNTRQVDILSQIIVILAGAFAVAILFKERDKA